jgi:inosine-uridine nucleoside N-ribohydrolase
MRYENYYRHLNVPTGRIDVVLDTDAYNEIDDQYAIAYLLRCPERVNVKGFTAAPFYFPCWNSKSDSPADGMKKSYEELKKILTLAGREDLIASTYLGSDRFMSDEQTPVVSDAAKYLAALSESYTEENPLYIVAIGAITNVASAFLLRPEMKDSTVVVWLGGHARDFEHTVEFNMAQDYAAARVIFGCGVPLVQLPGMGVADRLLVSRHELEHWLIGKNPLADYLARNTIEEAESYAAGKPWTRVIWDLTAVAWLVNDGDRFMRSRLLPAPIPEHDGHYADAPANHLYSYVNYIFRDALIEDLFRRLTQT